LNAILQGEKPDITRNLLKVHIVDANNLDQANYKVRVSQGAMAEETSFKVGPTPIWNEAIVFEVKDQ